MALHSFHIRGRSSTQYQAQEDPVTAHGDDDGWAWRTLRTGESSAAAGLRMRTRFVRAGAVAEAEPQLEPQGTMSELYASITQSITPPSESRQSPSTCPTCGDRLPPNPSKQELVQHRQSIAHRLGTSAATHSEPSTPVPKRRMTSSRWRKIEADNVGYGLLSRMGWSEGMGLGAPETEQEPRLEPVDVDLKTDRGGLGKRSRRQSSPPPPPTTTSSNTPSKSQAQVKMTRSRRLAEEKRKRAEWLDIRASLSF